ncbi:MAG: bifunctional UDP-N-acetylglucosamine diphosphorylase/glucosamine-1-phosphate N-acetyltransferase GlmU [gamma proteobacterium endosymbiont of Lamellibrachia anaximandri]|nr:bifunctional UDP-N-acetylglucosamine diphosphorylase/glucosamine-1-phosphate N-acetyltransferase GlmU [gamma proteobacterium endosymbiont of Lamellibrachia anaximandri]MBL3532243.1 bifunctional UDP-N-acetylglucosamine diphosphorylase/glucosamine-1-phosphate N-acetyltransferase GlmU [gamma proteobacterium endosymbiont of Lamellibrachia anaximandri]
MKLGVLILAAGQGTRMRSRLPKVLHPLAGKPLLSHVVETAQAFSPDRITVIYGHGGEQVKSALADQHLDWCEQKEQLGTGHAVIEALPHLKSDDQVLILYGDVPLISGATLEALMARLGKSDLALLTVKLENPSGYGRIVRDSDHHITSIVEQKDASEAELAINEINTGIMAVSRARLEGWLARIDDNNAQQEYYLTDIIALAVEDGVEVQSVHPSSEEEVMGINDRAQLAFLERYYQRQRADELMTAGASLADPARVDIRGELVVGQDVFIDCNAIFEGHVELADGVKIGPNVVIKNARIGEDVEILPNCVIEDAEIGAGSRIGPFARVRPETKLAERVNVGNFVEIKKSTVGRGSKINHLSYVGDSLVGHSVNIGAGTITCNYDGANKHQTVIGDNAFIGSDSQLVAPVVIGDGATVGAGSTITRDAAPNSLTLSRAKQITVNSWHRPVKQPKK